MAWSHTWEKLLWFRGHSGGAEELHAVTGQGVGAVHTVGLPRYPDKHLHEEFLSPAGNAWRQAHGILPERVPDTMILLYQNLLYNGIIEYGGTTPLGGRGGIYEKIVTLDATDGRVGIIGDFGIGAPVAAVILEDLTALGVQRFLSIGTAGGLQADLAPGDVVLCTSAVRDEGVSITYASPAYSPAEPDPALTDVLERAIAAAHLPYRRGATWTIDTPYRETAAEARHYQATGVQCVEMEAAVLLHGCAVPGRSTRSAFDEEVTADAEWNPLFDHPDLADLTSLYRGVSRRGRALNAER